MSSKAVNLSRFKLDIDELINPFAGQQSTRLSDMKKIWHSRKFSYIYEAAIPASNLAFFMQSLYAHTIGRHMYDVTDSSLSRRLGGLHCLYCLYETQPFTPPFKIYMSLGELRNLKKLVAEAKRNRVKDVVAVVKRMLEKDAFLFGFFDTNEAGKAVELQNSRVLKVASKKLLLEDLMIHVDAKKELGVDHEDEDDGGEFSL